MKTKQEIVEEIRNIDEAMDNCISRFNEGIITEDELNYEKTRLQSAKMALMWVIEK